MRFVEGVNQGKRKVPTIVFEDGSFLIEPSNEELAKKLGLQTKAKFKYYDLIVIGGGPAGLTAAVYAAREGIETLLIEKGALGGQVAVTERLENFPGFPDGITGAEFSDRLTQQARRFGAEILQAQEIVEISTHDPHRGVKSRDGSIYCARALLIATGARYKRMNIPGEQELLGVNIHYCATCDGPFYKGKELLVVGGGNSATEEGLFLTKFASKVTLVEIASELKASQILQEKVRSNPQMEVILDTAVQEFKGKEKLEGVTIKNNETGEVKELHPEGVFIFIGMSPNSEFLKGVVDLDEWGFIPTRKNLESSLPGVFAAGDGRQGSTNQAASAAGEGVTAALMIREYLRGV
ncbi:FAD-dependent oxidoreductase [candidate division TA06 bacterium]|nr:FAD-dependent oxidoreductase [candidate division TA06 bacterium]